MIYPRRNIGKRPLKEHPPISRNNINKTMKIYNIIIRYKRVIIAFFKEKITNE